jgi:6-phosphogluconolactonase
LAKLKFLVGSYADQATQGIYRVLLPERSMEKAEVTLFAPARNPSWISLSPDQSVLLAVEEIGIEDRPHLLRYECATGDKLGPAGSLLPGSHACHIGMHPFLPLAVTSQYGDGSAMLWHYGMPEIGPQLLQHIRYSGTGPNLRRQAASHAHFAMFLEEGLCLAVIDLGGDAVHFYDLDLSSFNLVLRQSLTLNPGCGPRHLARAKETLYIAGELDERVYEVKKSSGRYEVVAVHAPFGDCVNDGSISAIRTSIDGRYLYVAGRRQNAIAWMAIGEAGELTPRGQVSCGGEMPRDFAFDATGRLMLVANQGSDALSVFEMNTETGQPLKLDGKIEIPRPSCIAVLRL